MAPVPGPAFRDHLATVDRETVTTFVAAVYEARGWTVARDDEGLVATPPRSDRARRLVIRVGPDADEAAADDDGTVVDATKLHELVTYALPPDERTRLCRRFFDREPTAFGGREREDGSEDESGAETATRGDGEDGDEEVGSGPHRTAPRRDEPSRPVDPMAGHERDVDAAAGARGQTADGDEGTADATDAADRPDRSEWLARIAVVGIVFSLALGGIVTATGPGGVNVGSAAASVLGDDDTAESASTRTFPRGVDATGVRDAAALADAHEATLSNRSYRLTITYREFEDGELRGVAHERAVVASPNHYRSRVRRLGSLRHDSTLVASGSAYANGSTGYVRTADGVRERTEIRAALVSASADSVGFLDRTERTVQWYLSANDSRIVGITDHNGTTVYRIAFEGDPWPESRDVTGWARVDENGLVRELHREYSPAIEPSVRIEVTVRIDPGAVTVRRPEWLSSAEPRNGSYERPAPRVAAGPPSEARRTESTALAAPGPNV